MTPPTDAPAIDLLDPAFWQRDPHDAWTWARANQPVYRDERNQLWAVTRHAHVHDVERRAEVFSSHRTYRANETIDESNMIASDDPQHLKQRRLVNRRFTPRAVRDHSEAFAALVDELVEAATPAGRLEVIDGLAAQLPSRLTCRLLGLPDEEWPRVKSWSERLMRIDSADRDPEAFQGLFGAVQEIYQFVESEVPRRRRCPTDDLLSTWSNAEIDGEPFPVASVFHETGLFVAGGAETTRTVIAHGLRTFCDHPDQWELLHDRPELVPSAVEEMIRWVTPLNNMFRKATVATEVGGTTIRAGERLALVYPSANRDEDVFDDPFRFDVRRHPNNHLAFGTGTHFCIGANFARHELEILLRSLTARWTNLRALGEPDVEPNIFARAVRRFDLAFDPR